MSMSLFLKLFDVYIKLLVSQEPFATVANIPMSFYKLKYKSKQ